MYFYLFIYLPFSFFFNFFFLVVLWTSSKILTDETTHYKALLGHETETESMPKPNYTTQTPLKTWINSW